MFGYKNGFFKYVIADIVNCIGLVPSATRCKYFDVMFMYKLINGMIDCPELLSQIDFKSSCF